MTVIKEKKIDTAKRICAELQYNKEMCLQALVLKLNITRGNASIYFAKAVDASEHGEGKVHVVAARKPAPAPKVGVVEHKEDKSAAKIRDAHNKAHKHLSYTEPPKAAQ